MKKIGMIGIGLMGHGIAINLAKKGNPLIVLEHPGNQPIDDLKALGVTTVTSPRELAGQVDVVILCVTGTPQVEANVYGGLLEKARNGQIVLTPVRIQRGDAVRAKLAELDLSEQDIADAVAWARKSPATRK